jgi:hypothetical protein
LRRQFLQFGYFGVININKIIIVKWRLYIKGYLWTSRNQVAGASRNISPSPGERVNVGKTEILLR